MGASQQQEEQSGGGGGGGGDCGAAFVVLLVSTQTGPRERKERVRELEREGAKPFARWAWYSESPLSGMPRTDDLARDSDLGGTRTGRLHDPHLSPPCDTGDVGALLQDVRHTQRQLKVAGRHLRTRTRRMDTIGRGGRVCARRRPRWRDSGRRHSSSFVVNGVCRKRARALSLCRRRARACAYMREREWHGEQISSGGFLLASHLLY